MVFRNLKIMGTLCRRERERESKCGEDCEKEREIEEFC